MSKDEKNELDILQEHVRFQKNGFYTCLAFLVVGAIVTWQVDDADTRNILWFLQVALMLFVGMVYSRIFRGLGRAIAREEEKRAQQEKLSHLRGKENT